jgi:glycosyltransferase involved in cell wall biosynthesis
MRFSIFTPSHNLQYIDRPLKSLKSQTFKDFEWVLLVNGQALEEKEKLRAKLKKSKLNYRFVDFFDTNNSNIGYLKSECCNNSEGEILVELDHDDALEPRCLQELDKKFKETNADFVYTDDYAIRINPETNKEEYQTPFNSQFGWEIKEEGGKKWHPTFEPTALSFSYIWYAPDHVRSWKTEFYHKVGGHNIELDVCDDYDLMCRTYIEGTVAHINQPLYKYYYHEDNTAYGEKNKKIQEVTHKLHDKYMLAMASKWSDLNSLKKVDLCTCNNKPQGFIGVDKRKLNDDDVVFDLDEPNWPFEDGSVGIFRCQDALEHMKDPVNTMKEIHRCLAPLGWAMIEVPSTDGRGAFQDPTHVSYWNSNSFWYYTRAQQAHFIGTPVRFQLNRILDYHPSDFHKYHNIVYTKAHLVRLPDDPEALLPHGKQI